MTDLSTHPHTDQDPVLDTCPTCQHPLSAHDRIGLRWCAATKLGVGHVFWHFDDDPLPRLPLLAQLSRG